MQASALQSISRCYRLGLRRPAREFPARGFQSARPRRWSGASAAAGGADGGTAVEDTPATKGGKGGKRDLQEAYREVREMLTDPSRLVRAVASGKAKGADPEWRRLEMRPVALKGGQAAGGQVRRAAGVHLQPRLRRGGDRRLPGDAGVDARRVPTRPEPPRAHPWTRTKPSTRRCDAALATGASRRRGGALAEGDQIGRGRGQPLAIVAREREQGGGDNAAATNRPLAHDRQKSRLLSPSDPFLVHVGVSTKDGSAIKADRRDKYKQVEEFLRLVDAAVD